LHISLSTNQKIYTQKKYESETEEDEEENALTPNKKSSFIKDEVIIDSSITKDEMTTEKKENIVIADSESSHISEKQLSVSSCLKDEEMDTTDDNINLIKDTKTDQETTTVAESSIKCGSENIKKRKVDNMQLNETKPKNEKRKIHKGKHK